ncbi:MAG: PQQ-binding-like beta-propeller repeat protein, partial [Chloroflexota bacterium]
MFKRILLLSVILLFSGLLVMAQEQDENMPFSSYRADASNNGFYEGEPIRETPVELWQVDSARPSRTTPVVYEGLVYFGNEAGTFTAVDAEIGEE